MSRLKRPPLALAIRLSTLVPATLVLAVTASGAPGDADPGFGGDGKVLTNVGTAPGTGSVELGGIAAVAVQADGKLVVAGGRGTVPGDSDFALARYNPNGSLDPTFGEDGFVHTNLGRDSTANDIALQPDGRIVAAGTVGDTLVSDDFALVRYQADGSLDPSFGGGDGIVRTDGPDGPTAATDSGRAVALQADGRILLAGGSDSHFAVLRYDAAGVLDAAFGGGDGIVTTEIAAGSSDVANDIAVRNSDGTIVAAGFTTGASDTNDFAVARYDSSGALDSSFSGNGKLSTGFGGREVARAVAIQPNGRVVVAGSRDDNDEAGEQDFALARYTTAGALDDTLAGDGTTTTDIFGDDAGFDLALQTDGKIVVAGRTVWNSEGVLVEGFAVARYTTAGAPDPSFSGDGETATAIRYRTSDEARGVALQADGKIVAAGSSGTQFALARYATDGDLDPAFDDDGKVATLAPALSVDRANAVARGPDGSVVVAGSSNADDGDGSLVLARYLPGGALDPSFGSGGVALVEGFSGATDVAIQAGGAIVVAGIYQPTFSHSDFGVIRLNPDGSPDTEFGSASTDINSGSFDYASSVVAQPDGRVVVAGSTRKAGEDDFALVRYTTTGALDTTFGGDGIVTTDISPGFGDAVAGLALQPNGRLVAGGNTGDDFAVVRYQPGGAPDLGFGENGIALRDLGATSETATGVVLQADGGIVVAGSTGFGLSQDFALAAFKAGGAPDTAFGDDGIAISDLGGQDTAADVAILGGRVLVAGTSDRDFALARFRPSGVLDPSYAGGDGVVVTDFGSRSHDTGSGLTVLPSTRVVVAGEWSGDIALLGHRGDPLPRTQITGFRLQERRRAATIRFAGQGSLGPFEFECKLDAKRYRRCSSAHTYRRLDSGGHVVKVRATDAAGRPDPTAARKRFRI